MTEDNAPWYDNCVGLTPRTTTLAGLNEIAVARRDAFNRKEKLRDWCLLGRWVLDTCANFSLITDGIPAAAYKRVPAVLPMGEVYERYVRHTTSTYGSFLPLDGARCGSPACQTLFSIVDAHDAHAVTKEEHLTADGYLGNRSILTISEIFRSAVKAEGHLRFVYGVSNPMWIDMTKTKFGGFENERGFRECWSPDSDRKPSPLMFDRRDVVPSGSTLHTSVFTWFHNGCARRIRDDAQREAFVIALREVGINCYAKCTMKPIPNGYWNEPDAEPWYAVETPGGVLKIGWRKRVISIDWTGMKLAREPDFSSEDVTKWETGIHAWGYEKLTEYLKVIMACAA